MTCPFCAIVDGQAEARVVEHWTDAIAIIPRNAVAPGHVIVIPKVHVESAATDPVTTGSPMRRAAEMAKRYDACNIITSVGADATQTVFHLHIHVVPRAKNDGLLLPWAPIKRGDIYCAFGCDPSR